MCHERTVVTLDSCYALIHLLFSLIWCMATFNTCKQILAVYIVGLKPVLICSNGQGIVEESLLKSKDQLVTILFEASDTHSPIYSSNIYHNFFELKVNGLLVRSYEESEQAWKSDNKLTPFIVALFLIGGTYIWRKTKKEYKYTQY